MPPLRPRDEEYLWNRLADPAAPALEAHERLRALGREEEAQRLMSAVQAFTDTCRDIRRSLAEAR